MAQQEVLDSLNLTEIASGFESPTFITGAGDGSGRLFITEREGRIWALDSSGQRASTPFLDIRDRVGTTGGSEQGLFSVAFHPSFETNGRFFVDYTDENGDTVVSELRVGDDADHADPSSERIFFTVAQPFNNHNGGQLQFGPDGMLYVGTGDGGSGGDPSNNAQNLGSTLGKLLRFDIDKEPLGSVPPDNPFVGRAGAQASIWAIGLRNPWRFSFDRATGDLWLADVGQESWEEVNTVPGETAGINYGWRFMEGRHCYNPSTNCDDGTLTLPVIEYSHGGNACSVTGGYRYRGAMHPAFEGLYFFADFCSLKLIAAVETNPGMFQRLQSREIGVSVSTFGEDDTGEVYLADYYGGVIYRLDAPATAPALSQNGVVSAASYVPGNGIAPGSIVSVFGEALAGGSAVAAGAPLPAELGGTAFAFDGTAAAPIYFVSPGQANLQVPWALEGQSEAQLSATVNGLASAGVAVPIAQVQPGIFTIDQSGSGQAAALIAGTGLLAAEPSAVFPSARPAQAGETLEVYATGLGPVSNTPPSGEASPSSPLAETTFQVRARIGDADPVPVSFAGLAPGFVGLYQANVELAGDPPSGPEVPLTLVVDETPSNTVTIAIE